MLCRRSGARVRDWIIRACRRRLVIVAGRVMIGVWTVRHAWAIYQLNRGVGDTVFYDARGPAVVPARRAAARRPVRADLHLLQGRGDRGRGSPLLPASRHRSDRADARRRSTTCARATARRAAARSRSSSRARCSSRTRRTYGRKAQGSGAGGDARDLSQQEGDPRALPESRLPERRHLRRRDDVARRCSEAGVAADARRGGADRRHHPRPGVVLAVDALRRRAPAQLRRAAADARGKEDHGRAGAGGARRANSHPAAAVGLERAPRLREGIPAAAVPRHLRRRQPAGLEGPHDVRARDPGRGGSRRARRPAAPRRAGSAGGARRASIRRPATCWRWSAARTFATTPFNRAVRSRRQPGSAFKPFVYAAALEKRHVAGLDDQRPAAGRGRRRPKASGFRATSAPASRTR